MSQREIILDMEDLNSYYEIYTGNEKKIINWTKYRLYSVFDINNSPMKKILNDYMSKQNANNPYNSNNVNNSNNINTNNSNINTISNKYNNEIELNVKPNTETEVKTNIHQLNELNIYVSDKVVNEKKNEDFDIELDGENENKLILEEQ